MNSSSFSIGVTGVGGGAGQSIVKALQATDYRIVGMDGDALGAGLYAVPSAYTIPYANRQDFIPKLLEICHKENCSLLFPGLDAELAVLAKHVDAFAEIGTRVVVSNPAIIEIADNKLQTFEFLRAAGVSVPDTVDLGREIPLDHPPLPTPFIVKPRSGGARSKDVYVVKDDAKFQSLLQDPSIDLTQFVAQEYIDGDEFTCGSVTLEGTHFGTIVMRRILRDGDTYKCFTVRDARIEEEVAKVVAAVKPIGPLNVQLRVRDNIPYIFELNARCSGTTGARALSGFNEPKAIADFFLKGVLPSFSIRYISVLRYWSEIVVENDSIAQIRENGHLAPQKPPLL